MTDKQQKFIAAYQQTRDEKQSALAAGYRPRDAVRMARRTLSLPQVRAALLSRGVPLPEETAEETMRRCIAAHMADGTLKASEEFRAMELLWKLERETRREAAAAGQAKEKITTVRFEGELEQWSR